MTRVRVRAPKRGAFAAVAALAAALPLASARAHERPSYASHISSSGSRVAIQTTFGLIVGEWTDPTPGNWRWICPQAMGTIAIEDPDTFLVNQDTLLMPGFDGLTVGTNDACDWRPAADALSNVQVFSGATAPGRSEIAYALTSRPRSPNALYVTDDAGRTWAPTSDPLTGAARYDSVVVAPSDPRRIYVGASSVSSDPSGTRTAFVFRSDDAGATWTSTTIPMDRGERRFKVRAVNPTNADHVLASVGSAFSGRLVASTDGGRTFENVVNIASIDAVAWRPDGDVVVLSGMNTAGVWRSTDRGQTFEQVRDDLDLLCLTYIEDELWGCGGVEVETQVTRSADDGATWSPVMTFETDLDVEVPCPANTTVGAVCPAAVDELRADFGLPLSSGTDAGGTDGGSSPDGGAPSDAAPTEPVPEAEGAGCATTPAGSGGTSVGVALLGLSAGAAARARRRRAESRESRSR